MGAIKDSNTEPMFSRGELAKILNVTPLTIANREKRKQYPEPRRDLNNYRVYTLNDVLNIQLLTYKRIDQRPIMAVMFDKGIHNPKSCNKILQEAVNRRTGSTT